MTDTLDSGLGKEARERLEALLGAIRDAETAQELKPHVERFFAAQTEAGQYFSLIEREIAEKQRELLVTPVSVLAQHRRQAVVGPRQRHRPRYGVRSQRMTGLSTPRLDLVRQYVPQLERPWPRRIAA
jgi:hypothetical protein